MKIIHFNCLKLCPQVLFVVSSHRFSLWCTISHCAYSNLIYNTYKPHNSCTEALSNVIPMLFLSLISQTSIHLLIGCLRWFTVNDLICSVPIQSNSSLSLSSGLLPQFMTNINQTRFPVKSKHILCPNPHQSRFFRCRYGFISKKDFAVCCCSS